MNDMEKEFPNLQKKDSIREKMESLIAVQKSMMVAASSDHDLTYENINKVADIISEANPYGRASKVTSISPTDIEKDTTWTSRPTRTSTIVEPKENKEKVIAHILDIRNKLDEFLDGSNLLLNILSPQSIRETVKELRWECRTIKINKEISEMDIIKYQEDMYETRNEERI